MATEISLQILYGQLAVYRPELAQLNLWTDDHVAQGFAWREGNVSFGVPDHDGPSLIAVDFRGSRPPLAPDCIRAVEVPLRVGDQGVLLATVLDEMRLSMTAGLYAVRFELLPGFEQDAVTYANRIRLTFVPDGQADFAILRGDDELTARAVITHDAEPAC
ncbi:MAG: competence protein ComJ [Rhizobiaceae bacterium]